MIVYIDIDETIANTPDDRNYSMATPIVENIKKANKFYDDGNASAGTRIRKAMQQVKSTAQEVRLHVQTTKNNK